MIQDFMKGWHNDMYGLRDLQVGIQYAKDLIAEGHTKEPFHEYDLKEFIAWCEKKLNVI